MPWRKAAIVQTGAATVGKGSGFCSIEPINSMADRGRSTSKNNKPNGSLYQKSVHSILYFLLVIRT